MPYKKPLLKEIFVEARFAAGTLPCRSTLPLALMNALAEAGYTELELAHSGHVDIDGTTIEASAVPRIRCWTKTRTRCVQLSDDVIVINYADLYPGRAPFVTMVDEVFNILERVHGPTAVQRLHVVSVDELRAPSGFRLGDYFRCDAWIPARLADAVGTAQVQVSASMGELQLTMRAVDDVTTGVMLQTVFQRDAVQAVRPVVEDLLEESSRVFRSLITPRTIEFMGGEL